MDTAAKDLISNLPDALICHILSFLSTKEAALTSILSKRWRLLFAFVPNLDFDDLFDDYFEMGRQKWKHSCRGFKLFVDRVMALQGNVPLNKFKLRCRIGSDQSRIDGWILNVLKRGVVELDLYVSSKLIYTLLPEVLMSKTLVILKVAGSDVFANVREVFLPKLKILHMNSVMFNDENRVGGGAEFAMIISGCYALEELVMRNLWDFWKCSLSHPNLKKVSIFCENIDKIPKSVSFDLPNLVYLEYTDTVAAKYPKANFDLLVEASIGLQMTLDQLSIARYAVEFGYPYNMTANAADFLLGISNVKILYLSSDTLQVLAFYCKPIPVFNKLLHLTVQTYPNVEWDGMPNLLENCPNLETLVFEGLHYKDTKRCSDEGYRFKDSNECFGTDKDKCLCKPWDGTPVCLSSSPVKVIEVLNFGEITCIKDDIDKQVDLITYFVESMPNLEEVILYYDTPFDEYLSIVSTQFQKLEKVASSKCKIQVISDNISFSSTVYSSTSSSLPSGLVFFENIFPV